MHEGKDLKTHLDEFTKIILDLKSVDVEICDEDQAIILLSSLPASYENIADTLMYGKETITMADLRSVLNSKELQKKSANGDSKDELLFVRGRGKEKTEFKQGNRKRSKSRGKGKEKGSRRCFYCDKEGHFKSNCPELKKKNSMYQNSGGEASIAQTKEFDDGDILIASSDQHHSEWVIDSGCSFHMCPRKEWLENFQPSNGKVLLGDDEALMVKGFGDVKLQMHDGCVRTLKDVRLVEGLKRNLISVSALTAGGCEVKFSTHGVKVTKQAMVVMKGIMKHSLYVLLGEVLELTNALIASESISVDRLWHQRLGHISHQGLKVLSAQGKLLGFKPREDPEFCEDCNLGKAARVKFNKVAEHNSQGPLDYVHADVWGPARTTTKGGARYFLSLIDDYTRRVWAYPLKTKDAVFEKFKAWQGVVENQIGRRLKKLRTDNGMEFCSKLFNDYCAKEGIQRHKTCPYSPQQNGVAERMNRTILVKVRCMLSSSGMPKEFWGEALNTTCHIINRCPSYGINLETPMERWTSHKTDYSFLKSFGCAVYVHNTGDKLNSRALKGVFLGYPEGTKGYRVWCIEEGHEKMIVSRNVTFNEASFPFLDRRSEVIEARRSTSEKDEVIAFDDDKHLTDSTLQQGRPCVHSDDECSEEHSNIEVVGQQVEGRTRRSKHQMVVEAREKLADLESAIARDKPRRSQQPIERFGYNNIIAYALQISGEDMEDHVSGTEPTSFEEAIRCAESKRWRAAMEEEMSSLIKNHTWKVVPKAENQRVVSCKWIYKLKSPEKDGELPR